MDLRQLAALIAVSETGTFSAAATRLHTVQSNVSAHIARLEKILGATLVDRSAGRLTEEGEIVVARARRVQAELDAMIADVISLRHEVIGEVRVGVIGTVARWLVAPLHSRLRELHPGVHMVVVDASTTSLLPQLISGNLNLAIANLPVVDDDLVCRPLFDEEMWAIVPEGHALQNKRWLTLTDLVDLPMLLPPRGRSYRTGIDAAATAAGVTLTPKAEIDGVNLITALALDGVGIGIIPSTGLPKGAEGPWRRIPVQGLPRRRVGVVQRRRGMLSAPSRALLEALYELLPEETAQQTGVELLPPPGVEPEVPLDDAGSPVG